MSHVLEHLPNPIQALQRVHELLVSCELAYGEAPYRLFESALDTLDRWQGRQMEHNPLSILHASFFAPGLLVAFFQRTGFKVLDLRTYLPCRRAAREANLRLRLVKSSPRAAVRFLQRGDVMSAWVRRDNYP